MSVPMFFFKDNDRARPYSYEMWLDNVKNVNMNPVYKDEVETVYNGDALKVLNGLAPESVHCCVTSPPYDDLRTYNGHNDFNFEGIAHALYRVLVEGGVLCWNVADQVVDGSESLTSFRQGLFFVDKVGFKMHDRMIYEKSNFSHPERSRYHQIFEDVFILSKGSPGVFNPIKDKKNSTAGKPGSLGVNTFTEKDGTKSIREKKVNTEYGMRTNIWKGKTRGQEEMCEALPHPAMMPKWLARDLIYSWSNPGDIILDPMAGSGTTGKMAIELGRKTLLIERNPNDIQTILSSTAQRGFKLYEANSEFIETRTQQPGLAL